uniref:cyclin-K-like isoform X1 n=1 Tax=Ciona intestinalis TaxID=7719 RepID=UPI000521ACC6|nr:cyclin-K-like isoform X1 [Ciona intestinalis]|eukprot:XP_009859171.1 cyclin-K-like isoform X1 [Ciona intestinalis]
MEKPKIKHKITSPCWYYDKADLKKTPSFLDGVNPETEGRYRREGPRFIFDMGTRMGLHHDTIATGIVFFHRFYMFHSFKKFPRHITATCCLFLAGKVEETPKKCKDLIKVARGLLNEAQFVQFGNDPKEEVLTFEKVLLQTIKFDLTVEHPYKYMLQYAKKLKGDRAKIEKLVQMSWIFINDSFYTTLCLQWEPAIVAVAVMHLAGRLCKFEPQDWAYNRGRWWEQFIDDISMELLEDICHQVLDQYPHSKGKTPSNKSKRPKTPVDSDKSETASKSFRSESHKVKSKSNHTSAKKPHHPSKTSQPKPTSTSQSSRRSSSNTEVVAMETEDTQDHGTIEKGAPSVNIPTPSTTTAEVPVYFNNQYQYATSSDQSAYFMQQKAGFVPQIPNYTNPAPPQPPIAPPTPPAPQRQPFPQYPGSYDGNYHQFTTPEMYQQNKAYPPAYSGMNQAPTGLATVRITGRRETNPTQQWP